MLDGQPMASGQRGERTEPRTIGRIMGAPQSLQVTPGMARTSVPRGRL